MQVSITGPKTIIADLEMQPLITMAVWFGLRLNDNGDGTLTLGTEEHGYITDGALFDLPTMQLCVTKNCEVTGFACFVEMDLATYDTDTPAYLPGSTTTDEAGNTTPVKWSEWGSENHTDHDHNGGKVFELNQHGAKWIDGSIITQLIADGYNVQASTDWPIEGGE